ncbi:histidine kinase-, DNA gyrase B-, and HSP90-like ATPase family protein [Lysobacter antibioticus]|uniref:sensor histidine kinase n=1 Tax=Lysobacter antibioticus TaxID=84531 RepID=UPI00071728A0|nr:sensor histidine kinase [Lysobacter antibioticus]ALN64155.1 histidine kinase-, DNA gyrase B-, and HSP90-like ATPase family protein [Lysobacter antibioticus]
MSRSAPPTEQELSLDRIRDQYRSLLQRLEANEREFRRLGRSVWRVQEDERRRLARELHDGIGQNLTALKHRLVQLADGLSEEQRTRLEAAIALCADTLEDTRELSRLLRPPILDDLGLEPALRWLARSQSEASGMDVAIEIEALPALDGDLQTLLFRVAQEAINNAAKHAQARSVLLRLVARGGLLQLQVVDDGCGYDPDAVAASGGCGLGGMRERLRLYDGKLEIHSVPGEGTRLRAVLPLPPVADA